MDATQAPQPRKRKHAKRPLGKRPTTPPPEPSSSTDNTTSQPDVFSAETLAKARLARLFAPSDYPNGWPTGTDTSSAVSFPGPSRADPVRGIFGFPAPVQADHVTQPRSLFSTPAPADATAPADKAQTLSPVVEGEPVGDLHSLSPAVKDQPEGSSLPQPTTVTQEAPEVDKHQSDHPIASTSRQAVVAVPPPAQTAPEDQRTDAACETAAVFDRLRAGEAQMSNMLDIMHAAVMHALSLANLDELTELVAERAAHQ